MSTRLARGRINVPTTPQYADWLDHLVESTGMSKAVVVDQAIREFAAARNYPPPPRRTGPQGRPRKDAAFGASA